MNSTIAREHEEDDTSVTGKEEEEEAGETWSLASHVFISKHLGGGVTHL